MATDKFTSNFYVYVHRRASDGRVFYVGKGKGKRAWTKQGRSRYWGSIVAKHGYIVEIVQSGMQEWWAFEMERELIALYGRDTLCNLTNGGEGPSGRIVGDNEKQLKSALFLGRPLDDATKKKISNAKMGMPGKAHTEESRTKMSMAKKGIPSPWMLGDKNHMKSQEYRAKFSALFKGRKHPWAEGEKNHMKQQKYKDIIAMRYKGKKRPEITGANHKLAKKVLCVETGQVFDCIKSAETWLRLNNYPKARQSNICSVCTGNLKTAYGFTWKHA